MADHSPSSAFPSLHWTEGEPSILFDFSFPGGGKGAYELLALDETLGEVELSKQLKALVLEDLKLATAGGGQLPSQRLGAALVIACSRSSRQQGDPYSDWDDLCGTLFSVEAHLGLTRRRLPVPSARIDFEKKCPLFILPSLLVWDVEEPDEPGRESEAKGRAELMTGSWLIDFRTNDSKVLIDGELRKGITIHAPPIHELVTALLSSAARSPASPTADVPKQPLSEHTGVSGISEAQYEQLTGRAGVKNLGAGGGLFRRSGVSMTGADIAELKAEIAKNGRKIEQLQQALEEAKAREKKQVVDVAIQTDTFFPLVITRPSSPLLLPCLPAESRLATVENDLAAEKALPKIHLPTAALSLLPPALQLVNRLEPLATVVRPFKPVVPSRVLSVADKAKRLLIEAGEMGRLKEENEQLRSQLKSVRGPAHPPSVLALSRLDLDRPSDCAAYVVRRLVERLGAVQRKLRDVEEEKIDLLLQLAGE
ncbi:hypothetical protein JCM10213_003611 [Rhodosporidiobolus nylandii]